MSDMSTLEKDIEDYLCLEAGRHGGLALKLRPDPGRGFPDRTLILPRCWAAFVEVKRSRGGKFAKHQADWRSRIIQVGHRHYLVSTMEEVDQIFNEYRQER